MNQQVWIVIAVITAYLVWLIIFVLVIEGWLRRVVGLILGVTITRELGTFSGGSNNITIFDVLDAYRWKVEQPAGLSLRLGVGILRVGFWLIALILPVAVGLGIYFGLHR
jgi:hypothetical protein